MNDAAVIAILSYMEENLFEPQSNWPKIEFDRRSYSRWAANEILERIMDHPFDPALSIVERFLLQVVYNLYMSKNEKAIFAFSTAMNTAGDIMLLIA